MKIQRLHLDGFGRWTDAGFEFAPGLNVIYGANQAGKSTMQQALLAMRSEGGRLKTLIAYYEALLPKLRHTMRARGRAGGNGHVG